jgi:hypothetical protein
MSWNIFQMEVLNFIDSKCNFMKLIGFNSIVGFISQNFFQKKTLSRKNLKSFKETSI